MIPPLDQPRRTAEVLRAEVDELSRALVSAVALLTGRNLPGLGR